MFWFNFSLVNIYFGYAFWVICKFRFPDITNIRNDRFFPKPQFEPTIVRVFSTPAFSMIKAKSMRTNYSDFIRRTSDRKATKNWHFARSTSILEIDICVVYGEKFPVHRVLYWDDFPTWGIHGHFQFFELRKTRFNFRFPILPDQDDD